MMAATGGPTQVNPGWNPTGVMKSGWLHRQSSVLHRWKKSWFVLYTSGRLSYFEDEHSKSAENHMHVPAERAQIINSKQMLDIRPPENLSQNLLFGLKTHSKTWNVCAEDVDELTAWQLSLEEAAAVQPTTYGEQQGWPPGTIPEGMRAVYPDQVKEAMKFGVYDPNMAPSVTNVPGGQAIQLPPGSTMYLTRDGPVIVDATGRQTLILQRGAGGCYGPGGGFLAGAAMGSMLMWPWIFWMPLFFW